MQKNVWPAKNNEYKKPLNLKEAAELIKYSPWKLRDLARKKIVRSIKPFKKYLFYAETLLFDIENLAKVNNAPKSPIPFKSECTRYEFALLFKLLTELKITPKNKKLFCEYLFNAGIFESVETSQKIFYEFETKTKDKQNRIKNKLKIKLEKMIERIL